MMGTLAAALAGKKIRTSSDLFRAEVKGTIEDVNGVLKITRIHVVYYLHVSAERLSDARQALAGYIESCPAAQSVAGCIAITHELVPE